MNTKLLLLLFYSFSLITNAQDNPTPTREYNSSSENLQNAETTLKQFKELKKRLENLKDAIEKSDQETIGFLKFKLENTKLHSQKIINDVEQKVIDIVRIDSIHISIKDGTVNDLSFYVGNNKYTNKEAPIPLTHSRFTKMNDKITLIGGNDYFIFQEIVQPYKLSQYVPDDIDFTANIDNFILELKKGVGLNNIFDIRLYSDALALFGNEENGLVQTDLRYKNILHRRNLTNGFFYLQYVKVNLSASKFDTKDKYIEIDNFKNSDILRKSYFNAEVALNLLNGWIEFKSQSKAYLDMGFGIGSVRVKTVTDTLNVTSSNFFIEGGLNLKSSSNIGLDINARITRLFSPSTQNYSEYLNNQYFNFLKFGADFYWYPFNEKANRLFARVNYITPTLSIDKKNAFFQFQIGYSVMLSDLIK